MESPVRNYRKDAFIIFVMLTIVFAYFYQDSTWNGNSRFGLIFSSVEEGRLQIDDYYNTQGTITNDLALANGHYYSDKAIGPAVIGAILYAPIHWVQQIFHHPSQETVKMILTFLVIGIPSAIAGSLMYILCLYLSGSRFGAYLVTLTIALGTMYLPYSVTFFSHQLTSSLLFSAFFMIFFLKEGTGLRKNGYLFLIGLLLGWAVISEFPSALIVLVLVIYYLFVIRRNKDYRKLRSLLMPLLGGLIPILLQLVYDKICFGSFFSVGYSNLSDQYFSSSMSSGLMGIHLPNLRVLFYMTLHPTLGLFWQSPALLLAFVGAVMIFHLHRYRAEGILAIAIICAYFVMISGYYQWWGGYALGPRHIIPVLPFFCILLAFVPKKFYWPFAVLSLFSIAQMLIAAATTVQVPDTMIPQLGSMGFFAYSNIYNFCLPILMKDGFIQNLGYRFLRLTSWRSLIPLLVVMVGINLLFFWNEFKANKKAREINAR
jgi:hypothetical protein